MIRELADAYLKSGEYDRQRAELERLNRETWAAVERMVNAVCSLGGRRTAPLSDGGEAYAYPDGQFVAWGVNDAGGVNIARGRTVRP